MKATKLKEKVKMSLKFFWPICMIIIITSCDVLESDSDVLSPTTDITGKEIFVLSNSASFIDLNAKLQTNVQARIAVTSEVRNGKLTDLGQGILEYSPSVGNTRARDGFEFTVYATNNEIIKRDSIIIIIENDSTNLPCNIYPVTDYVHGVKTAPVLIDVLSNDIICAGNVSVSVYKPENSFPPFYGTAEVQGNKIKYSPGSGFEGADKIMYKITVTNDTSRTAYGMVYLTGDSVCSFRLVNDLYVFGEHAVDSLINLPVLNNDSLCQSVNQYLLNLKSQPVHGQATVTTNEFRYKVPASVTFPFADYFTYEVCIDAVCKTARVDIRLKKDSVTSCLLQARPDSINIVNSNIQVHYIDVLRNDTICGGLQSLNITKAPLYGTSIVSNQQISYEGDPQQEHDDSLEYEICASGECRRATVLIKRTN